MSEEKQPTQCVCPNCGYCPHCGRGGYKTVPYWPYAPYNPWGYPYGTTPYITYTTTGGQWQAQSGVFTSGNVAKFST